MIATLTWVSIFAGGLLIILMLISIIGGLDFDLDIDGSATEIDGSGGGIGVLKGFLTFVSVSSWMIKVLLVSNKHIWVAVVIGLITGFLALLLLNFLFKQLLKNDENVNWKMEDALHQEGVTYLKIPSNGSGIVHVPIRGTIREIKAKSIHNNEILTGTSIIVMDIEGEYLLVEKLSN